MTTKNVIELYFNKTIIDVQGITRKIAFETLTKTTEGTVLLTCIIEGTVKVLPFQSAFVQNGELEIVEMPFYFKKGNTTTNFITNFDIQKWLELKTAYENAGLSDYNHEEVSVLVNDGGVEKEILVDAEWLKQWIETQEGYNSIEDYLSKHDYYDTIPIYEAAKKYARIKTSYGY